MKREDWTHRFPPGCEVVLATLGAAIARLHDDDSPTRERYFARDDEFFGDPLLGGDVYTLHDALGLVTPEARAELAPSRPPRSGMFPKHLFIPGNRRAKPGSLVEYEWSERTGWAKLTYERGDETVTLEVLQREHWTPPREVMR